VFFNSRTDSFLSKEAKKANAAQQGKVHTPDERARASRNLGTARKESAFCCAMDAEVAVIDQRMFLRRARRFREDPSPPFARSPELQSLHSAAICFSAGWRKILLAKGRAGSAKISKAIPSAQSARQREHTPFCPLQSSLRLSQKV